MNHSYILPLNTPTEDNVQVGDSGGDASVLDLSKRNLKKVPKPDDGRNVRVLVLDENELQKIDNIDSFLRIEKLSLRKNSLLRMYGVCRLHFLQELNLSNNKILTIEGLKDLVQLKQLNLQGNNIKTIEHLNSNLQLEILNLSENCVGSVGDLSMLKNLKELYLNGNRLTHLRHCDRYLPTSLITLTLDHNNIADLNELCTLGHLSSLNSISIQENPCVSMCNESVFIYKNTGFDYRPFVLNWCMTVKVIDGFAVNPIESLKAEWLYSQGRGRQFRLGEQAELAKYLSSVCPLTGETLENEEDRKLRLILSKAQQHQRQLKEEISENTSSSANNSPSSNRRRGTTNRIQSPRFSRLGRSSSGSPDSMSSSYHGNTSSSVNNDSNTLIEMSTSLIENVSNMSGSIMSQSLDATILSSPTPRATVAETSASSTRAAIAQLNDQQAKQCNPLASASKMVPVPESLMSPDCPPTNHAVTSKTATPANNKVSSIKSTKESKLVSPKVNRTSAATKKSTEKSPVLNVRKNNSINAALKANMQAKTSSSSPPPPAPSVQQVSSTATATPNNVSDASSDDDSDHINIDKLKKIRSKAAQRTQEQHQNHSKDRTDAHEKSSISTEDSAILIQKIWRGYNTRKQTKFIAENLQKSRTQEYIEKLSHDMETTKVALENERKIQQLQMQAINALWKKVSTLQPTTANSTINELPTLTESNSTAVVQDLAKTCSVLTNQVQQLQGSMRDIIQCMSVLCKLPQDQQPQSLQTSMTSSSNEIKDSSSTQTEIVAVHTPQVENLPFPFANKLTRPSTLSLSDTIERKIVERGEESADKSTGPSGKGDTPEKKIPNFNKHSDAEEAAEAKEIA